MATPFEVVIQLLRDLGFYNFFFPFIITAAIMYALFRKSKVLGENIATNAIVSLSIAFLVFGFPVLAGLSLETQLSTFFTQITVWILIVIIGIVIASVFYPDLSKLLSERFTSRSTMWTMLAVAISIFVVSGLVGVFINIGNPAATGKQPELPGPPTDLVIIIAAIIIFIVLIIIAAAIMSRTWGG